MTSPYALPRHPEYQYLDLLRELIDAPPRDTRNDTATRSVFGRQMRFDLANGFPLLTTKKLPFRVIAGELIWFLSGSTNAKDLEDQGIGIWRQWGDPETRELGPVYGKQWRSWYARGGGIDQIAEVLQGLRDEPHGRRHIVSAWNPADLNDMALPPCHCLFQFYVEADGRLSLQLYQRSADVFLGLGFNIASYALLLTMFASALGRTPGVFVHTLGDAHLYGNHIEQARQQILRDPRKLPTLSVAKRNSLDGWQLGDFTVAGYSPWDHIAGEVSA